jgi:protein SCO1/2
MGYNMKKWVAVLCVMCLGGCLQKKQANGLPYYNSADFTPQWFAGAFEAQKAITHTVAPFAVTAQRGQTVTAQTVKGKIHVADFFFTACGSICPKMQANFAKLQTAFMRDTNVLLLSYTVTPWIDSVAKLKAYGEKHGVNPGKWLLLTGGQAQIYAVARRGYFAEEETGFNKDSTEFLHTEHFILVDKTLRIRGIYNGTLALEAERLEADIKKLEQE